VRILVTGACGFVGSTLVREWAAQGGHEIIGIDNFVRPGSELNRAALTALGVTIRHGDVRLASDFEALPACDAVVDAAANPSVLAGIDGRTSSRQLVEHNLVGTINMLEYCRTHRAAFVMLSTSRVYSIPPLAALPVRVVDDAFEPAPGVKLPDGMSVEGIDESFSTAAPVSLYGSTKVASEQLALEYGAAFDFPVWINRCGVLAGAGQFGKADQGIFSYWINSWLRGRPLKYIGFEGTGHQVRDCLHPADLVPLIDRQFEAGKRDAPRVVNVSGGRPSARSLAQLSRWCREHIDVREVARTAEERPFDLPWVVLDARLATRVWNWTPLRSTDAILAEILEHAHANPSWLDRST
jgi:CDP-paratose 2-epimerase